MSISFKQVLFYLILCVCELFKTNIAQEYSTCITPSNVNGECINIIHCQFLLDFLRTNANSYGIDYLQKATCGFEGIYPLVCCPLSSTTGLDIPTNTPATDMTTNNPGTNIPATVSPPPVITRTTLPVSPNCGVNSLSMTNKVVNGDPAKLGEFPWMAALGYRNARNPNEPRWLCAGTLITEKHILTAGHCTYNRTDLYLARLGDLDINTDSDGAQPVDITIEKIKPHEGYDSVSITNDIAIVTLSSAAPLGPLIRPICMPTDQWLRSQTFVRYYPFVAGWGALYFDGPPSSLLKVAMLPVVSNDQCKQSYANFKNTVIDDRVLCAGYATGGKDACQGDSGGPLMLARLEEEVYAYYQIGVVSYGFKCAEAGYPGVYSRVTSFLDWIENNLN